MYGGFIRTPKFTIKANYKELFELNLSKFFSFPHPIISQESMKWRKIKQKDSHPGLDSTVFYRFSADVYGNHLLILKNEAENEVDKFYYCNRRTCSSYSFLTLFIDDLGSWSAINVDGLGGIKTVGNSVTYNNTFYACVANNEDQERIFLAALDLDRKMLKFGSIFT